MTGLLRDNSRARAALKLLLSSVADTRSPAARDTACSPASSVQLFQGDSDWARCMEPPYRLLETSTDTTVELELPFWIDNDDVRVKITATDVDIEARTDGLLSLFFVCCTFFGSRYYRQRRWRIEGLAPIVLIIRDDDFKELTGGG